jgi:glucuronosyltransferase
MVEGVPVLGIPIFGDQKMNMAKSVAREYGLQIFFEDISEKKLSETLNELLNNPKYRDNARLISSRFIDRPMTPQETVVYWTEYAVRHKGAPHLRAAGNSLNFIQFHSIDVYAVMILIALGFVGSLVILLSCCKTEEQSKSKIKIK